MVGRLTLNRAHSAVLGVDALAFAAQVAADRVGDLQITRNTRDGSSRRRPPAIRLSRHLSSGSGYVKSRAPATVARGWNLSYIRRIAEDGRCV